MLSNELGQGCPGAAAALGLSGHHLVGEEELFHAGRGKSQGQCGAQLPAGV